MRKLAILIPVLWLLTASVTPARADFDAGMAAYERGDFEAAFTELLPLAEAGDPVAQYRIGALYSHGEGVEKDDAKTLYWYRKVPSMTTICLGALAASALMPLPFGAKKPGRSRLICAPSAS